MSETWEQTKARLNRQGIRIKTSSPTIELEPSIPVIEPPKETKRLEERWMIYSFTLPPTIAKKIGWGFESKEDAKSFINTHLTKYDGEGKKIQKFIKDVNEKEYLFEYDTILESRDEVNIYANDPILTTVGMDLEKIIENWLG